MKAKISASAYARALSVTSKCASLICSVDGRKSADGNERREPTKLTDGTEYVLGLKILVLTTTADASTQDRR